MKLRSTRICKPRAPLQLQLDSHQNISTTRRRSSRLHSSQRSVARPLTLGSYYEPQGPLEQRPIRLDPQPSQLVGASSYTRVPISDPIEVSGPILSTEQFQEYPSLSQTHNHQTRKRGAGTSIEIGAQIPLKRARLTEKNLELFEMGGRQRKSAGQSSLTTTAADVDFGIKLKQNGVVYASLDARAPDDVAKAREILARLRESEPPDQLDYKEYLAVTEEYENKRSIMVSAYSLLAKRTVKRGISGYFPRFDHAWSEVDSHITTGLGDAQPDLVESYRKTNYLLTVVEALSGDLAPSSNNEAMPAYAVEFRSNSGGNMREAKLQCGYNGALMTEGAHAVHTHMGRSDDGFYGRTQALTVAFNGETLNFYAHHAVHVPASSPATYKASSSRIDRSAATVEYHQYLLNGNSPRNSFEQFQTAYRHIRNAQDIGYTLATERKYALWAYTNGDNAETTSAQQLSSESLAPVPLHTPPQSSKDISVSLELQQLSVPTVIESKKTRGRTRHAVPVEGQREVGQKSKPRKTRTKHHTP